jgi:polysaccharide biosynthesis transport protein
MRDYPDSELEALDSESASVVWGMFRRQRRLVLGLLIAGAFVGTIAALSQKRTYQAVAVLQADARRAGLPTLDPRVGPSWTGIEVSAEIEVLRSRALAALVVDSLDLQVGVFDPPGVSRADLFTGLSVSGDAPPGFYRFARQDSNGGLRVAVEVPETTAVTRVKELIKTGRDKALGREAPRARRPQVVVGLPDGEFRGGDTVDLPGARVVLAPLADSLLNFGIEIKALDDAVGSLLGRLKIRQAARDAGIIHIEYRGRDRNLVTQIPNVLAATFLANRRRTQQTDVRSTIGFLRNQLDSIGIQLAATEFELQTFREINRVVDLDSERSAQVRRLVELQADREQLEVERSALSDLLADVRSGSSAGQNSYRRLSAFPSLLRSSTTADLVRSITRLEDERAALLSRRQPNDPDVRALTSRVEQLEREFQTTVNTYLEGLSNQIRTIDSQLAQSQRAAARLPEKEARYARLTRQAKLLEDVYSTLKSRLTEAEVLHAAEDGSIRVVDLAAAEVQPLGPRRAFMFGTWALLGLLAGSGLGLIREYRDGSVRSRSDLQVAAGVPVLGLIPRMGVTESTRRLLQRATPQSNGAIAGRLTAGSTGESSRGAVVLSKPAQKPLVPLLSGSTRLSMIAAEAYRRLHLSMLRSRPGVSTRVFLVTSPLPGDGKTTTAANLAITLAQRGYRVVIVDADLRQGPLRALFGAEMAPSLAELLASPTQPDSFQAYTRNVVRSGNGGRDTGLDLIAAGKAKMDPAILLDSPRFPELIDWLRSNYDIVIIDSPPAAIVTDATAIGAYVDGVVLVARSGSTPVDALQYVAAQFRASQVTVLGTVLNDLEVGGVSSDDAGFKWYEHGKDYFTPPVASV